MLWEAICDTNAQARFNDDLKIYELAYSRKCDVIIVQAISLVLFGATYEMEIRRAYHSRMLIGDPM